MRDTHKAKILRLRHGTMAGAEMLVNPVNDVFVLLLLLHGCSAKSLFSIS